MTDRVFNLLNAPRWDHEKLKSLMAQREAVYDSVMPTAIRYDLDKVQSSPEDPMTEMMARLEDIDRKIIAARKQFIDDSDRIVEACADLPCEEERTVITMYYIGRKSMIEIADTIGYARSRTYEYRQQALKDLDGILLSKRAEKMEK